MPLIEAKPVIAPSRGSASHQFTGGHDSEMFFGLYVNNFIEFSSISHSKMVYYNYRNFGRNVDFYQG